MVFGDKNKNMQDENKNKNNNFLLKDDLEIDPLEDDQKNDYSDYGSDDDYKDDGDDNFEEKEAEIDNNEDEKYSYDKKNDYYDFKERENSDNYEEEGNKNDFNNRNDKKEEDGWGDEDSDDVEIEEKIENENIFNDEKAENKEEDACLVSRSKILLTKSILENIKDNSEKLLNIFSGLVDDDEIAKISLSQLGEKHKNEEEEQEGSIIEGVFDGENMIGPDGKQYSVPANYASKSKLVEGDILKLTITGTGTFIYKQIGPIERIRIVGELDKGDDDSFFVRVDGKKWRILPASVTYFKGKIGDEVVLLIPKSGESKWAAVENIIRNKEEDYNN
jgi:hypothetical protein